MAIDERHLTLHTLRSKSSAIHDSCNALKNNLNGDFDHDVPIMQLTGDLQSEDSAIASRIAAIVKGGDFTPPTDDDVNALGTAVAKVNQAVQAADDLNAIIKAATDLLNQYGANASK